MQTFTQGTFLQSFEAYCNLMKIFIYSKENYGHAFLSHIILPFYRNFSESSEISILNLFSKMIDYKYCNEEEVAKMIEIVNAIIERGEFYLDARPALFNLITKISTISDDAVDHFLPFAKQTFIKVKDEPLLLETKVASANFLLTMLNKKQEEFQEDDINSLLNEILAVFPCKKFAKEFFVEMKNFLSVNEKSFTRESYDIYIAALSRYLSYQNNAAIIFDFDESLNDELVEMFENLLSTYYQKFNVECGLEGLLNRFLPDHPLSIQYILSHLN